MSVAPFRWGALLNIVVLAATLRAAIVAFGPAADRIGADLELSSVELGLLGALPLIAFGLVAAVAHRPIRWFGFDLLALLSLVTLAIGILTRLIPDSWAMWVGTGAIGVGIGVLNVLAPAFVKRDFPTRLPLVTGMYTASIAAAAATGIALVMPLTLAFDGNWRIGLAASLPVVLLSIVLQARRYFVERAAARAGAASNAPALVVDAGSQTQGVSLWRSPITWAVTAYMGIQSLAFYAFINWAPLIEMSFGYTEAEASTHLALNQILGIPGSLIVMFVMQRVRDNRFVAVGLALLGTVPFLGMLFAPQLIPLWTPLLGAITTSLLGVALALIGERSSSNQAAAKLSGMAQSIGYLIAALGPVLIGGLFEITGSWIPVLWCFVGCMIALAAAGFIAGRDRTVG
ncbi:MAG: MFS transporter [Gulosibacter sp.]|uniref:MFS transporter n=1 Tax=Gulosibacter sp. TaxID=2817531 RepID=UPI003F904B8E